MELALAVEIAYGSGSSPNVDELLANYEIDFLKETLEKLSGDIGKAEAKKDREKTKELLEKHKEISKQLSMLIKK